MRIFVYIDTMKIYAKNFAKLAKRMIFATKLDTKKQ
jgi:hypothetical protein